MFIKIILYVINVNNVTRILYFLYEACFKCNSVNISVIAYIIQQKKGLPESFNNKMLNISG